MRLERASQNQSSDIHKTPYDRAKRCRERKINIKSSERVNQDACGEIWALLREDACETETVGTWILFLLVFETKWVILLRDIIKHAPRKITLSDKTFKRLAAAFLRILQLPFDQATWAKRSVGMIDKLPSVAEPFGEDGEVVSSCRLATRHSFQLRRAPEVDWPLSVGDSLIRPRQTALQSRRLRGRMVNHVAWNCSARMGVAAEWRSRSPPRDVSSSHPSAAAVLSRSNHHARARAERGSKVALATRFPRHDAGRSVQTISPTPAATQRDATARAGVHVSMMSLDIPELMGYKEVLQHRNDLLGQYSTACSRRSSVVRNRRNCYKSANLATVTWNFCELTRAIPVSMLEDMLHIEDIYVRNCTQGISGLCFEPLIPELSDFLKVLLLPSTKADLPWRSRLVRHTGLGCGRLWARIPGESPTCINLPEHVMSRQGLCTEFRQEPLATAEGYKITCYALSQRSLRSLCPLLNPRHSATPGCPRSSIVFGHEGNMMTLISCVHISRTLQPSPRVQDANPPTIPPLQGPGGSVTRMSSILNCRK
ncbi:hypothetical protein PR048_007086 [Dryococelus australis]|uniref:Uncharacterized protein n=1 Tax=Dryococelus australis TaxID=614101 RepID=A0ABQ9ICM9_9NEOP|nr:hypothetical protein PR048_007086 [Dryococelus australis]